MNLTISFFTGSGQGNSSSGNIVQGPIIGGPFTLVDTENQIVTEKNLLGNWVLMYFGYTSSPDVGPEQVQIMAKAIEKLGLTRHFDIIFHELIFVNLLAHCIFLIGTRVKTQCQGSTSFCYY